MGRGRTPDGESRWARHCGNDFLEHYGPPARLSATEQSPDAVTATLGPAVKRHT